MRSNLSTYCFKDYSINLAVCQQIEIMSEYLDFYIEKGVETVSKESFDDMKKLISFCCAFTSFMPADSVFGCTVSLPAKKQKNFCAFDKNLKSFVARSHKWDSMDYDKFPRLAVQKTSKSENMNSISMVDCVDECDNNKIINRLIERYFEVHGNNSFKTFEKNDKYLIVNNESNIYNSEDFIIQIKNDFNKTIQKGLLTGRYFFKFNCGCNKEKIITVFSTISTEDKNYLFENNNEINVDCPRCGLKYFFNRGDFEKN